MTAQPGFHRRPLLVALVLLSTLTTAAAVPVAPVDPGARMLDEDAAGEYWDVSVTFTGGAFFFVRFWITNEGPGAHTGVVMGYFLQPGGKRTDFKFGRQADRWTLGGGGRYLQIATATLDLRGPDGRLEVDTDKHGVLRVFLRFAMTPDLQPLCARRGDDAGFDVLRLGAEVKGLAWVEGMTTPLIAKGFIDVTHGWSAQSEIDYLARRVEVSGRDDDLAFYAVAAESPAGERDGCVAVTRKGAPLLQANVAMATHGIAALDQIETDYPVPAELRFTGEQLELTVSSQRELLRVNPLNIVPQPFRALLSLRSSPRRIWTEASWHLRSPAAEGRPAIDASGTGVTSLTFPNPWRK